MAYEHELKIANETHDFRKINELIRTADTNETNEIPEMKARLLRLESELERINKLLMNSDLLDPEFAAVITDHF